MMFSSTIFDVVFGLVSVFLAISLFTSAVTEALSTLVGLRARTLLSGVKQLLNDPNFDDLALSLYNHALVNPLSAGVTDPGKTPSVKPSYIEPGQFALAFVDVLRRTAGQALSIEAAIEEAIGKIDDPQIKTTLDALYRKAGNDADAFIKEIAGWFDSAMTRVSGIYKRYIKAISFVVALLLAALFNADAIHIADTLWERPALAERLTKLALPQIDPTHPETQAVPLLQQIEGAGPLLGWNGFASDERRRGWRLLFMISGWVVAAGAALFGAPFWFDVLQRFVQLRGSGRPPEKEIDRSANRPAAVAAKA
jgi:hypothetical protein